MYYLVEFWERENDKNKEWDWKVDRLEKVFESKLWDVIDKAHNDQDINIVVYELNKCVLDWT